MSHMIQLDPIAAVMLAIIVALWVAAAVAAIIMSLRRDAIAKTRARDIERQAALLASAPAVPFRVGLDGRIASDKRLAHWLGLASTPASIDEMAGSGEGGISVVDAEGLAADVAAANQAARAFERVLHLAGTDRVLMARGRPAPASIGDGVIVWLFDHSDSERVITQLSNEASAISDALDSCLALIEAAPFPMWHRGPDLKLALVNSAYVAAVEGPSAEEVVSRGTELIDATEGRPPRATALAARDSGRVKTHVVPVTLSGQRRTMRIVDVPMGEHGVAGYAFDIQDLEQTRGELGRFQEAQRELFDRLSAGVAQFGADRSLIFFNQPFLQFFALAPEWLADRPEFDRVLERMREANRLPEVRDFPGWKAERRDWFLAAGGAIEEQWHLPGGAHLRVVAQPLPDGGLLLIFEDQTEQIQLASARDTLLRVRTATFDNLYEALGVFAADGRLQLWNNKFRALWGFDEAFLATHPRVDALAEAAARQLAKPARVALIADLVRAATVERAQRGGQLEFADGRFFELAAVPLPDGNGLFTMFDISDSHRIERALRDRNEALEAADQIKTAFVANMSYELRTPLTSISGFAEMLSEGYAGKLSKDANTYVDAIMESVERLGLLVDEVLDLTLHDGKTPAIEMLEVDLEATARAAADAVQAVVRRKKLDFAIEVLPSTGTMKGDALRLRQVIEHLLRHAIGGSNQGGRILLHTDGTAAAARIVVSDDGAGMSPDAVARAFDRFAQPGVTRSGERALGLGLPLAKQFVEAHGGTISLVSEPGEGTFITVELPRR